MSRSNVNIPFIIAAALLLAAALGLDPALSALESRFTKQPIPLRKSLDQLDAQRLPSFTADPTMQTHNVQTEGIETEDWASIGFRDTDGGTVTTLITYYSDPRSQVPHTPEVCYRQGGGLVTLMQPMTIQVPDGDGALREDTGRLIHVDQTGVQIAVVYVFSCNGTYYHDREQVRLALGLPGDRYSYFSKVEAVTEIREGEDPDAVAERCGRLLTELLVVLEEDHFPTREQLK